MMKKYLWVLALALLVLPLSAGNLAADSSHAQQDLAFLGSLAQQPAAQISPALSPSPVLAAAPPAVLAPPAAGCINLGCGKDSDCWPYCGGPGGSYCSHNFIRQCVPY